MFGGYKTRWERLEDFLFTLEEVTSQMGVTSEFTQADYMKHAGLDGDEASNDIQCHRAATRRPPAKATRILELHKEGKSPKEITEILGYRSHGFVWGTITRAERGTRLPRAEPHHVIHRKAGTRTTSAIWSAGVRTQDARATEASVMDDIRIKIRGLKEDLIAIIRRNPMANPHIAKKEKMLVLAINMMETVLAEADEVDEVAA
jgi:hypothetical protein